MLYSILLGFTKGVLLCVYVYHGIPLLIYSPLNLQDLKKQAILLSKNLHFSAFCFGREVYQIVFHRKVPGFLKKDAGEKLDHLSSHLSKCSHFLSPGR